MLYERILAAAVSTPWAIAPEKLRVIESFLARKAKGETISDHEILAAKQQRRTQPTPPGGVGVVPIYGTITQRADLMTEWSGGTSTDEVGKRLDSLAADPNVKAIVLDVDSPGGSVYGVASLADKIKSISKEKKVIGVANSEAASAAYWLLSQASEVVVDPSGQVGSIGVYVLHVDRSEAMRQAGQSATLISAGERKTAGNSYGPLDPLGREEIQNSVNDYYSMFVKAVASGRNVAQSKVRSGFGKGGMMRAEGAVNEGMADKVGTLESVLGRYGLSMADVSPAAATRDSGYASNLDHEIEIRKRRLKLDGAITPAPLTTSATPLDRLGRIVCYHESGHAIVAVALGVPLVSVSVVPDDRSLGRVRQQHDVYGWQLAAILSAAGEAEKLCLDGTASHDCILRDDTRRWAECSLAEREHGYAEAARLVKLHAGAIHTLASKLRTDRTATHDDVVAALRG